MWQNWKEVFGFGCIWWICDHSFACFGGFQHPLSRLEVKVWMLFDFDKWPGEYLMQMRQLMAAGNVQLERPSSTRWYLMVLQCRFCDLRFFLQSSLIVTINSDQFGIFDTEARWPSRSWYQGRASRNQSCEMWVYEERCEVVRLTTRIHHSGWVHPHDQICQRRGRGPFGGTFWDSCLSLQLTGRYDLRGMYAPPSSADKTSLLFEEARTENWQSNRSRCQE